MLALNTEPVDPNPEDPTSTGDGTDAGSGDETATTPTEGA